MLTDLLWDSPSLDNRSVPHCPLGPKGECLIFEVLCVFLVHRCSVQGSFCFWRPTVSQKEKMEWGIITVHAAGTSATETEETLRGDPLLFSSLLFSSLLFSSLLFSSLLFSSLLFSSLLFSSLLFSHWVDFCCLFSSLVLTLLCCCISLSHLLFSGYILSSHPCLISSFYLSCHVVSSLPRSSLSLTVLHPCILSLYPGIRMFPAPSCCRSDSRHSGKCGMLQWAHSQWKRETERLYVFMCVSLTVNVSLFSCVKERVQEITESSGSQRAGKDQRSCQAVIKDT